MAGCRPLTGDLRGSRRSGCPVVGAVDCGSVTQMVKCTRDQARGNVHDRNDPLIGHPRRTDHPQGPDDTTIHLVGGDNHRELVHGHKVRLAPNEDLHPPGAALCIKQLKKRGLLIKDIEEATQAVHVVGKIGDAEQVALTGNDNRIGILAQRRFGGGDGRVH